MDKKVTGIVAYLWWIGWALALFLGDKEGAKFHLNQALVLNLASLAASLIGWIISFAGSLLTLVVFVLWIIAFVGAVQGKEKAVPLLGGIVLLK